MKWVNVGEAFTFKLHGLAVALRTASLVVAVPFVANNVLAEEEPAVLQKVVVSAAGYEQKVTDAPSSISVITQEELKEKPYMTLLDAVRELEGVDIGETRDKTGQGTISMRGMGSDYTLILVDGKRQNNHGDIYPNNFGGNQFGHIPPLDAIERIEVIRGPASTLYGADAMGGVINIITKKVTDKWMGSVTHSRTFESRDEYGSDITTDFNVMGPLIKGKLGLAVRGSVYNRQGSTPTYDTVIDPNGNVVSRSLGFGGGGKTVDSENEALGASLNWRPADNQMVMLDVDTSKQTYDNTPVTNDDGVVEYPVGTVDSLGAMLRVANNGRVEPRAGYTKDQEFTRDTWALSHEGKWDWGNSWVSLSYVSTNNKGRTLPFTVEERKELQELWNIACNEAKGTPGNTTCTVAGSGFNNNLTEAEKLTYMQNNLSAAEFDQLLSYLPRSKRTLESEQYTLDAKVDVPYQLAGDHVAVVGGQVIRGELNDGVFGMESGSPGKAQEHNMWSVFAEDTWYIVEPFALTFGLRYDDHEVFGDQLSPRVYGVYTINPQWTLKGGVSTGFKTPKTTQLYDGIVGFGSQGVSPQYGNPNLQPETSISREIAVYWQNPAGHNFNATLFYNEFEDKIANQPCGGAGQQACASVGDYADLGYTPSTTRATNIDEVVIQGLELAGRWQIIRELALRGNYTYADSEQKSGVNKGLPLGNSPEHMANVTLDWKATERFNLFLTSEFRGDRYRGQHELTDKELYYKDYAVLHLGASFTANEHVSFNFRINNLLDKDFTTYDTEFNDLNGDNDYLDTGVALPGGGTANETRYYDDYNNKEKRRSLWAGINVKF